VISAWNEAPVDPPAALRTMQNFLVDIRILSPGAFVYGASCHRAVCLSRDGAGVEFSDNQLPALAHKFGEMFAP
jgi:hypothetical protein